MQRLKNSIKKGIEKTSKLSYLHPFFLALLLYSAYRWSSYLGWLVFFMWPFLLCRVFDYFSYQEFFIFWLTFFTFHFWWIFIFLIKYAYASVSFCFLLYSVIVFSYVMVFWGAYFLVCHFKCRIISVFRVLFLSTLFFVVDRWGGSFGEKGIGYPLLHPVLPMLSFYQFHFRENKTDSRFVFLRPSSSTIESLYHALEKVFCLQQDGRFFVTPEFVLEEDLTYCDDRMVHLYSMLLDNDFLLVGAVKRRDDLVGHATYVYNNKGLIACFEKELLVPFYEYVPVLFASSAWAESLFLHNKKSFSKGARGAQEFFFDCFICADFFLKSLHRSNNSTLFFIQMNDRCLPQFVVDLLLASVVLKCFMEGATGFCVGWNNSLKIF